MLKNKKLLIITTLTLLVCLRTSSNAQYVPTNKDTNLPPEKITYTITEPQDFTLLYQNADFKYYFKDSDDVMAIYDKRNGYTWMTGLDIPFGMEVKDNCESATAADKASVCTPIEDRMNSTYTGIANSLVSVEYYNQSLNIDTISSASETDASSKLYEVNDNPDTYELDVTFTNELNLSLKVHIDFTAKGMSYAINADDISGPDKDKVAAIMFNPFLGASGGVTDYYDSTTDSYDIKKTKDAPDGYVFVPDGPGSLIRFENHSNATLSPYDGDVYGPDLAQETSNTTDQPDYVPYQNPTMPVYGIALGDNQAAFVGYATSGGEYMQIVVYPENNKTYYTWAYPEFVLNNPYNQIYNQEGQGYTKLMDTPNTFNIKMNYDFLAGDGSSDGLPANYVGMAEDYRDYLLSHNILEMQNYSYDNIPMRADFLMDDSKKNVVGYSNVTVTNIDDVKNIINDMRSMGIDNINSGLYGYENGGVTLGVPWSPNWDKTIGSEAEFSSVINALHTEGVDISYAENYALINSEQMSLTENAAKHVNGLYFSENLTDESGPVTTQYYARPTKAASWLLSNTAALAKTGAVSTTIDGISDLLYSDYNNNIVTANDAIKDYQTAFADVSKTQKINAVNPNMYLWQYVSRYLQSPVYPTQYLIETDTVPFLQMVLSGTMEQYAPYANFSFYTQSDILRMIDYNVYPSFILTQDPSYDLQSTNSSDYYSTKYSDYKEIINNVYTEINGALKYVINAQWTNRQVLASGVILNSYSNGVKIIINYTSDNFAYNGTEIPSLSYLVIK